MQQAEFLFVYIREAHPGSIIPGINEGKAVLQTDTMEERRRLAAETVRELELNIPVVVDKTDNKANSAYAGWPERMVVVGVDGKVAYKGARSGPSGFKPAEVEEWLKQHASGDVAKQTVEPRKGRLVTVDAEKQTLTVAVNGTDQTFQADKDAKFLMAGRNNQVRSLPGGIRSLRVRSEVTLTMETKDGQEVVTQVVMTGMRRMREAP